ncbi:MAG: putative DNA binding domain-containing protein [Termitinemataceae bacterium]|nr:MAG: putative DNA binding domain-containing protein [Termitinemataceae bacterium]
MNEKELYEIISKGESSKVQFKEKMPHIESLADELIALSNSYGGTILFGVNDKTGALNGLSFKEIQDLNAQLANAASQKVYPPIFITTETIAADRQNIVVANVKEGSSKPYKDSSGVIYVKNGSDKRKVTSNDELARLLNSGGVLFADEMEVFDTTIEDADERLFSEYFEKEFSQSYTKKNLSFEQALKAKKVLRNGHLTLAGLLFFGKNPQIFKPVFTIKTVSYIGNCIGGNNYITKPEDLHGTIPELFKQGMMFLKSCLMHLQNGRDFNTIGILEISEIALLEILQNALIHRDYFKNSPIRILIFENRVEIISPGKLPNSLTIEEIKYGNPVIRNNQIALFSTHTLPYSGLGSGLRRAFEEQPNIELINDIAGEQFIAIIPRKIGEIK